ncbi:unnamed protein product [Rhizophagus irregularis]|nr:unnamed protein product [Rhizophagus irregularis]
MVKYENKRATEFLETPKSPHPTRYTSGLLSIGDTENFKINSQFAITDSSLRYGRENDNGKFLRDKAENSGKAKIKNKGEPIKRTNI